MMRHVAVSAVLPRCKPHQPGPCSRPGTQTTLSSKRSEMIVEYVWFQVSPLSASVAHLTPITVRCVYHPLLVIRACLGYELVGVPPGCTPLVSHSHFSRNRASTVPFLFEAHLVCEGLAVVRHGWSGHGQWWGVELAGVLRGSWCARDARRVVRGCV